MIKIRKRLTSLLLAACMLLPLLPAIPVGTHAAQTNYTYNLAQTIVNDGIASDSSVANGASYTPKSNSTWSVAYASKNLKLMGATGNNYLQMKVTAQYSFVAFHLKDVEDGIYNLTWTNPVPTTSSASECQMGVYVMPYNSYNRYLMGSSLYSTSRAKGTYTSLNASTGTINDISLTGSKNGYVVVFRLDSADYVDKFFRIGSLRLNKSNDSAELPDAGEAIVTPELVQENAVSDVYFLFGASSVVNGHTYLYLAMRGSLLIVYDIDEQTIIDSEDIGTHPRSVYVDEDGMVWSCGGSGLFMYDPYTGEPSYFNFPKGTNPSGATYTAGVTGDGKGNIYFGTAYEAYLGKFNKATETFSWLGCTKNSKGVWSGDPLMENGNWLGYAGLIYREENGVSYLYAGMDGKGSTPVHDIIKYDISKGKIVDRVHITLPGTSKYLTNLNLIGDVLFGSTFGRLESPVYIDLTGGDNSGDGVSDTMRLISSEEPFKTQLPYGHYGEVSDELDGKVYFMGWNSVKAYNYYEYDVADRTVTMIKSGGAVGLRLNTGSVVNVDFDGFTGKSLVTPYNGDNTISLYFYNLETGEEMKLENIVTMDSSAAGHSIRAPQVDATGKYVYVGAFGSNLIAKYGIEEGTVVDAYNTYSYQTDSILFHGDYMFTGNYSAGTVTMTNLETREVTPLYTLRYSVFEQCRMWTPLFAENKIFMATTPYSGFGGMLVWYDFDKNLTYVAAGPNPEDVYYADTSGLTEETSVADVKYTWYNAATNQKADMTDVNGDNVINYLDAYLADGTRQFRGPIENHVINNMIYKDGLIYGTSSAYGSSGTGTGSEEDSTAGTNNAVLFVYDIAQMKVIATCDLSKKLDGFTDQVKIIDQLAEDPNVPGKFWGVISDTLFTMTYDVDTKEFTVTEELSIVKNQKYSLPGCAYTGRKIIFDGPLMYVSFSRNVGTYLIMKDDPSTYRQISTISPNKMVMAADGNLYWVTNQSFDGLASDNNIYRFTVSQFRTDTNLAKVTDANGAVSYAYTNTHVATALGIKGNTVTLLKDVDISEAVMADGVVLDLNGHTITGDVATMQGVVTDSSNGGGLIAEKPVTTAPGQVVLKDGDDGYRLVNYSVVLEQSTAVTGDDAHFWYRITLDSTSVDAYSLAKADDGFTFGVNVTAGGKTVKAEFEDGLTEEWANAMASDNGTTGIHLCILGGANVSMSFAPTINGVAHTDAIKHSAFNGDSFTLNIPGIDGPVYGTVILSNYNFS